MEVQMAPIVSVIVPVYNCEKYISSCLDTLLNQTYTNIEIIIVNDGSIDGSEKIIKRYKERDNRIVYYYQKNSGPSAARNKGIQNSSGEYLVFIDSDDTVQKYYIESMLNKMINSNSDLVTCGYKDISVYGILDCIDFQFDNSVSIHTFMDMVCKGTGGVIWGKLYKLEIIKKYNLEMDKNIFMSEDLVFVLQYASHSKSFASIKEYLYNYNRLNQNSISSNISISYMENYYLVCKHMENIFYSVNMDERKMNQMISKRIQDVVINLVEQQSININTIGVKNAINNVKKLVTSNYIEDYKYNFSTNISLYKPFVFLLKNEFIKTSIAYGVLLNLLRSLKKRLKRRR
jgi:glycosyltransferase involved in cell wall biosynthesis